MPAPRCRRPRPSARAARGPRPPSARRRPPARRSAGAPGRRSVVAGAGRAEVHRDHEAATVHEHRARGLVDRRPACRAISGSVSSGRALPQRDERPVPPQHPRRGGMSRHRPRRYGSRQSSFDRRNVSGSCGSGTTAGSQPMRANSAIRPSAVARPSSGSGCDVKNCHGVDGRPLLAHEQHRRERREQR